MNIFYGQSVRVRPVLSDSQLFHTERDEMRVQITECTVLCAQCRVQ